MNRERSLCAGLAVLAPWLAVGCARQNTAVASTFPQARMASPWVLEGEVWSGSFGEAAPGLGPDAADWRPFEPTHVWLAVYRHESDRNKKLTARGFAFDTPAAARQAFERFQPLNPKEFRAGDEGCWTEIGVLFRWGRLVFDIFGSEASWHSEVQSAQVASFILTKMPPGLPDAPR